MLHCFLLRMTPVNVLLFTSEMEMYINSKSILMNKYGRHKVFQIHEKVSFNYLGFTIHNLYYIQYVIYSLSIRLTSYNLCWWHSKISKRISKRHIKTFCYQEKLIIYHRKNVSASLRICQSILFRALLFIV